jgi:hypothetical protein
MFCSTKLLLITIVSTSLAPQNVCRYVLELGRVEFKVALICLGDIKG